MFEFDRRGSSGGLAKEALVASSSHDSGPSSGIELSQSVIWKIEQNQIGDQKKTGFGRRTRVEDVVATHVAG